MRSNLFWLDDEQWSRIEPHMPSDVRGKERVDDRRVISAILHLLKSGCRWKDCPPEYGPYTMVYNRFARWAERRGEVVQGACPARSVDGDANDRQHACQIPTARRWAPERGGRNRRLAAHEEGAIRRSTHWQMLRAIFFPSF